MKTNIAIAAIVAAYLAIAALQDGPIQVWLVALAPVLLLGVGFVLDVGDRRESGG